MNDIFIMKILLVIYGVLAIAYYGLDGFNFVISSLLIFITIQLFRKESKKNIESTSQIVGFAIGFNIAKWAMLFISYSSSSFHYFFIQVRINFLEIVLLTLAYTILFIILVKLSSKTIENKLIKNPYIFIVYGFIFSCIYTMALRIMILGHI